MLTNVICISGEIQQQTRAGIRQEDIQPGSK